MHHYIRYSRLSLIALAMMLTAFTETRLSAQTYKLVWSDEFDSSAIDKSKWVFELGAGGWGNNELEYYTSRTANAYIDSGCLVIKALREDYPPLTLANHYTSARMKTQGKASWKYGKIEARIKLPYGQGIWPAFWMLGDNISSVGWPKCGEIDIMEMIGGADPRDRTVYGTGHWDVNGAHSSKGSSKALSAGRFADDFHIFSIVWKPTYITWYLDGVQYFVLDITNQSAFQNNQFILLNLAVGGNWPGVPDLSTVFPQTMKVDYVRVYQESTEPPEVTITAPAANQVVTAYSDLTISADAKPAVGTVTKVEFYQDAMKIGEAAAPPYQMIVQKIFPGLYHFSARAILSTGAISASQALTVSVAGEAVTAPYGASASVVPGSIESENYDIGDAENAYSDSDQSNAGGAYRSDAVDIEACTDIGGGYDVGWTAAGEWMLYTIDVKQSGQYQFSTRVASLNGGGSYHIEIDNADVTGAIAVASTQGWQTWTSSVSKSVQLTSGVHRLKFCVNTGGFNVNRIDIALGTTGVNDLNDRSAVPGAFALRQNYPNPFNPSTTIAFDLPDAGDVRLEMFTVLGVRVATLVDAKMAAGRHHIQWNASTFPSGVYVCRLTSDVHTAVGRLILQK
ncbi:MAG TPA: family 16 glycosylhydrolase [Bacteroidota bacterium]|nr:family 16 glycosylhydrolase [Bacteroidota bacterium]